MHNEIEKLSALKDKEINEAKKILAFEVTKIVRGKESAEEALEISRNIFDSKINDDRLNNYSVDLNKIESNNFSIIDAIENLKLVNSRSEIKRLVKSNGIKVNDIIYKEENFSLKSFSKNDEIKISVGKKKIGILYISK